MNFEPGLLTAIVSGVVTVLLSWLGIRATSKKIQADTEASIALKEAEDRASFRRELMAEVDRLRQDCDRLRSECARLTGRVSELEREVVTAEMARAQAEAARAIAESARAQAERERDAALVRLNATPTA